MIVPYYVFNHFLLDQDHIQTTCKLKRKHDLGERMAQSQRYLISLSGSKKKFRIMWLADKIFYSVRNFTKADW